MTTVYAVIATSGEYEDRDWSLKDIYATRPAAEKWIAQREAAQDAKQARSEFLASISPEIDEQVAAWEVANPYVPVFTQPRESWKSGLGEKDITQLMRDLRAEWEKKHGEEQDRHQAWCALRDAKRVEFVEAYPGLSEADRESLAAHDFGFYSWNRVSYKIEERELKA